MNIIPIEIKDEEKQKPKDFTRKRSLPFPIVIMILLNLIKDGNRKGYEITMNTFWSEAKRYEINLSTDKHPKKSSFSKARKKIKAKVIKNILEKTVNEFDNRFGEHYLWKGLRVYAVDGTKYTLPASEELIELFGCQKCGVDNYSHYPLASISVLFNVKSKTACNIEINRVNNNEREDLIKLSKFLCKNDLIIADRGYPSYLIFDFLSQKGINFLIRIPETSTFKIMDEFIKNNYKDEVVELKLTNNKIMKIRIIKVELPTGEKRFFMTNLLDKNKYSHKELSDLYYERWEIEEHYKTNKELFKVENFHSKSKNGILQEIYAQLILSNIIRYMINEAEENNKQKDDVPSFKNAVCVVERYINEISLNTNIDKIKILYKEMLKEIRSVRYKKIKWRKYIRQSFKPVSKWSKKK